VKNLVGLLVVLAACGDSKPSQQEAFTAFGAATAAMSTAQSNAVQAAQQGPPSDAHTLNYNGPCTAGGTVRVTGSYQGDGGQAATFDLDVLFDGCTDGQGTLDGSMSWTSTADGTNYSATMAGDIAYDSPQASASCGYDLHVSVSGSAVAYSGSVCGYNVSQSQ
jgi:hypothetical protein